MASATERWETEHEAEQGPYSWLAGFEADIRARDDEFTDVYGEMDLIAQLALFNFVCELLAEAN
jgi:hypothetical protein